MTSILKNIVIIQRNIDQKKLFLKHEFSNEMVNQDYDKFSIDSGVARAVAGVAEAKPIFQILFNKFGQKIRVKKAYLLQATPISKSYLPPCP